LEKVLNVSTTFTLGTLMEAKAPDVLVKWIDRISDALSRCPSACIKLILELLSSTSSTSGSEEEAVILKDLLCDAETWAARKGAAQLVATAILSITRDKSSGGSSSTSDDSSKTLVKFFAALVGMMEKIGKPPGKAEAYYYLLLLLCRDENYGEVARGLLLNGKGLLTLLSRFIDVESDGGDGNYAVGGNATITPAAGTAGVATGDMMEVDGEAFLGLIDILLRSCVLPDEEEKEGDVVLAPLHVLSPEEVEIVRSAAFVHRLVESIGSLDREKRRNMAPLVAHLLREDRVYSEMMIEVSRGGGGVTRPSQGSCYMIALSPRDLPLVTSCRLL